MDGQPAISDDRILVVQVITGAMVIGVVMFAALVTLPLAALMEPPSDQFISLVGAGFALVMFFAHLVLPSLVTKRALDVPDGPSDSRLATVWQTQRIIALALLEGAAFFNLIALLLEHNWWSLAISGCLVLWMLLQFPTRTRVRHWIENQKLQSA